MSWREQLESVRIIFASEIGTLGSSADSIATALNRLEVSASALEGERDAIEDERDDAMASIASASSGRQAEHSAAISAMRDLQADSEGLREAVELMLKELLGAFNQVRPLIDDLRHELKGAHEVSRAVAELIPIIQAQNHRPGEHSELGGVFRELGGISVRLMELERKPDPSRRELGEHRGAMAEIRRMGFAQDKLNERLQDLENALSAGQVRRSGGLRDLTPGVAEGNQRAEIQELRGRVAFLQEQLSNAKTPAPPRPSPPMIPPELWDGEELPDPSELMDAMLRSPTDAEIKLWSPDAERIAFAIVDLLKEQDGAPVLSSVEDLHAAGGWIRENLSDADLQWLTGDESVAFQRGMVLRASIAAMLKLGEGTNAL